MYFSHYFCLYKQRTMKKIVFLTVLLAAYTAAHAQNFHRDQRTQEKTIHCAYKRGKVTEQEYHKLMKEQQVIRTAIRKYDADGRWTPHEKNVVHDKLVRADKRLDRYKTNGEVY
jgi:hypothetical protein